ncbi:MAG: hypothetical protein JW740_02280 [Candidatus Zambryskibacteria bacterium]|nr:hypothetical protein [Candidatus Zambryskibacteria bacterium]
MIPTHLIVVTVVSVSVFVLVLTLFKIKDKGKKIVEKTEILGANGNGDRYLIKVVIKDGFYYLPFKIKNKERFISKPNRNSAKKELVQCVRDPYYRKELEQLIKEDIVKKTKLTQNR